MSTTHAEGMTRENESAKINAKTYFVCGPKKLITA